MGAPDKSSPYESAQTMERLAPFEEAGRELFNKEWTFLLSAPNSGALPLEGPPEIAFAGRSNAGKSSLINGVVRQSGLARTSNTPGRTQALNYFHSDADLRLVDMPGYGFAKAPKGTVDEWNRLIRSYLRGRSVLRRVFVMVDSRHGLKANDLEVLDLLDQSAVSYEIVLTKGDKIKPPALQRVADETREKLRKRPAAFPDILVTSSEKKLGFDALRAEIASVASW